MDLDDRDPAAIAYAAAETVRELNHRTQDAGAFSTPADVADVVAALAVLVERLPQALQQTSAGLRRFEEQQAIRMDDGAAVDDSVAVVLRALLNAQGGLAVVQGALREAAGPLSHMGGHFDGEDVESVTVV